DYYCTVLDSSLNDPLF
nr:immunoglobulin light chain junction region [Macaca mulatta]MOW01274.1 immunoglobulin light chain junction region [Macaca mulatta]